jgi:hypothetical protein
MLAGLIRNFKTQSNCEPLVPLNRILHLMAQRDIYDEGFVITTNSMSLTHLEFQGRAAVSEGETLRLKLVHGSHVLNLQGLVEAPAVPGGRMLIRFVGLDETHRRLLRNVLQRYEMRTA